MITGNRDQHEDGLSARIVLDEYDLMQYHDLATPRLPVVAENRYSRESPARHGMNCGI